MTPVVTIEGLEFSYGAMPVLRGVDVTISPGELVCLLGPNGVGKTTLVENLLGLLSPSAGTVRVLGTDPTRADAAFWSRVGLVQQNWSDHPKWRVRDHLARIRAMHLTVTPDVVDVEEVLDAVGLAAKATSRISRLSGGQRRVLDLAATLLARPELLVLDEPTTGLDPVSKARVHDLVLERIDGGATVLMTTHDLAEAEHLASRVLVMSRGRILADATVPQLRERLDRGAEVTWLRDGQRHVHSTTTPERFVQSLDPEAISGLTVTRPTLEDAYLALVAEEQQS